MKNTSKKTYTLSGKTLIMAVLLIFSGCTEDFLEPDPLSFYEPTKTFSTLSGLEAALAMADRHLRTYWSYYESQDLSLPISSEYMLSDLAVASKTDDGNIFIDIATRLTPTEGLDNNATNRLSYFWGQSYSGIKYANTVISYIDGVEGIDEATKNEFVGRAYFHRSFRYLALTFQFKDIPLVTKLLEVPKLNYRSTKREAILQMITADMEKAVQWVPEQSEMDLIGMVNKGACRQLLIKCYLASGEWDKAIAQADTLIEQSGYELMVDNFGTFINPLPNTWPITRNVIWDLHRPENKSITENKEAILSMPNRNGTDATIKMRTMRNWLPWWDTDNIKAPNGKRAIRVYARSNSVYDSKFDYNTVLGRGVAHIRPTYFATNSMWYVNGVNDAGDLRHSTAVGNWAVMDSLKYSNQDNPDWYGDNLRLYDGDGAILCADTIRCWFDWPHYKTWIEDDEHTSNSNSTNNRGGAGDWYCFRLAETYLLRAEAKFYKGDIPGATIDVNKIRTRAKCTQTYSAVTIGDIMDERARELWMEEWRYTEMSRVSYCLALSGKTDEWGNAYSVDNLAENSYWYQRIQHYNNYYNKGAVTVKNRSYTMAPHNVNLPIPQSAINSNRNGMLRQNQGYDGYDAGTPMWETWEEAVADESQTTGN